MKIKIYNAVLVVFIIFALVTIFPSKALLLNGNPSQTVIRAKLKEMALKYNIPSVILMGIAYTESAWKQFDVLGNPVIHTNMDGSFDIGIMQINSTGRSDIELLKTDIFYNIEIGAKILDGKWRITPGIGDRDRNILENWYYAIWAYNGFSYTNHPANPLGRRYQEKVLDNIARLIIGDDGQPLWMPIAISRPDPLIISNPPQWISTPVPYHFGDLYTGLYEGDNFRLLQAVESPVVKSNTAFNLVFKVENIGTTTWKNLSGINYSAKLIIESGNKAQSYEVISDSIVEPGGKRDFVFNIGPLEEGIYKTTLKMFKGTSQFGQDFAGNLIIKDNIVNYSIPEIEEYKFGDKISFDINLSVDFLCNATIFEKVYDASGNPMFSKGAPLGNSGEFFYPVGEGILESGNYRINLQILLSTGPSEIGLESIAPAYLSLEKEFKVSDARTGIFVNSNISDCNILINGSQTNYLTPSFIEIPEGTYVITLAKEGYSSLDLPVQVQSGVNSTYGNLVSDSPPLISSNLLDLGSVYKGNSLIRNLTLTLPSSLSLTGTVRTSVKWLFVYPLSFTDSTTFTISFDSRFLDEGANLTGTIYFNINGKDYAVNVSLTTLYSTALLYIIPESSTARVDDNVFLEVHFSRNNLNPQSVAFEISYDENFISFVSWKNSLYELNNFAQDKNIISFEFANLGNDLDLVLCNLQFKALKTTASMSTQIKFTTTFAYENGIKKDVINRNASIKILEKLVLPGPVLSLTGEPLINKIKLQWNIPQKGSYPIKEFEVYRAELLDFNQIVYIGSAPSTSNTFIDEGPLLNKVYYYWVVTVDSMGNSAPPAGPIDLRPLYQTQNLPSNVKIEFTIGSTTYYVNGIALKMEVAPFIQDGRTYVPVRFVAQPFSAQVIWNAKERKVTLIHKNTIELWIGNPIAKINGENIAIDKDNTNISPFIVEGRTMLPLRFVSESLGAKVIWDGLLKKITIEYSTKS